jgi:hypothetical protein
MITCSTPRPPMRSRAKRSVHDDRPVLYGGEFGQFVGQTPASARDLHVPHLAALTRSRLPLTRRRPGPAPEMPVVPRRMDRGLHWRRSPHGRRRQYPPLPADRLYPVGVAPPPPRVSAIPIRAKPARRRLKASARATAARSRHRSARPRRQSAAPPFHRGG